MTYLEGNTVSIRITHVEFLTSYYLLMQNIYHNIYQIVWIKVNTNIISTFCTISKFDLLQ
jgi:hypothetical protein